MVGRSPSLLVALGLFTVLAACRSPLPPAPGEPAKPTPDAGLPGDETPSIEPDTGSPLGPGGAALPETVTSPR